jgi:hypothetical protein
MARAARVIAMATKRDIMSKVLSKKVIFWQSLVSPIVFLEVYQ